MNQPKRKHLKRYPVHPWAVPTGTDGKTVRYSAVVYRRNMGTEDSQNAFNVKKATRIEISKRRHARLGKAPTANWPPMPKPGSRNEPYLTKRCQVSRRAAAGNRTKSYGRTG